MNWLFLLVGWLLGVASTVVANIVVETWRERRERGRLFAAARAEIAIRVEVLEKLAGLAKSLHAFSRVVDIPPEMPRLDGLLSTPTLYKAALPRIAHLASNEKVFYDLCDFDGAIRELRDIPGQYRFWHELSAVEPKYLQEAQRLPSTMPSLVENVTMLGRKLLEALRDA